MKMLPIQGSGQTMKALMKVISQPKHPWCKKVVANNLKKAMLKKMRNENGRPKLSAIDEIKISNNDDQAAKHYYCLPL